MLEEYQSIKISTYRIMFMGTAHQGSGSVHIGKLLMNAASVFVAADDRLMKHLEEILRKSWNGSSSSPGNTV